MYCIFSKRLFVNLHTQKKHININMTSTIEYELFFLIK